MAAMMMLMMQTVVLVPDAAALVLLVEMVETVLAKTSTMSSLPLPTRRLCLHGRHRRQQTFQKTTSRRPNLQLQMAAVVLAKTKKTTTWR